MSVWLKRELKSPVAISTLRASSCSPQLCLQTNAGFENGERRITRHVKHSDIAAGY